MTFHKDLQTQTIAGSYASFHDDVVDDVYQGTGPFTILARYGKLAYKIDLSKVRKIHPVMTFAMLELAPKKADSYQRPREELMIDETNLDAKDRHNITSTGFKTQQNPRIVLSDEREFFTARLVSELGDAIQVQGHPNFARRLAKGVLVYQGSSGKSSVMKREAGSAPPPILNRVPSSQPSVTGPFMNQFPSSQSSLTFKSSHDLLSTPLFLLKLRTAELITELEEKSAKLEVLLSETLASYIRIYKIDSDLAVCEYLMDVSFVIVFPSQLIFKTNTHLKSLLLSHISTLV